VVLADKIIVIPSDGHDVLDHIWGWSQLVGALVGLVALVVAGVSVWYARKAGDAADDSAKAAERTAAAAEETAIIARQELDMLKAQASRRAVIELRSVDAQTIGQPLAVVLAVGLFNSGDADAPGAVLNLVLPPNTTVAKCSNERGDNPVALSTLSTPDDLNGVSPSSYIIDRADLIRTIAFVAFYRLEFASAGRHTVRVKAGHPLSEPVAADALLDVS
jgi:hypothetical protein